MQNLIASLEEIETNSAKTKDVEFNPEEENLEQLKMLINKRINAIKGN